MIKSIEREPLLEGLLAALEHERYVRAPLLQELIDELCADRRDRAVPLAKTLLARVERAEVDDAEMKRSVDELRHRIFPRQGSRSAYAAA